MAFSHIVPASTRALRLDTEYLRLSPKLKIVNVVSTGHFDNAAIDAADLTYRLPGVAHDPARFAAAKLRSMRAMMLVFGGGKAVCPGADSIMSSRIACQEFTEMLLRAGYIVCFRNFKVQNIVCHGSAGFGIDIHAIREHYPMRSEYKPEKFPGLTFRMKAPLVVFNIFMSGNVICTGSEAYADSSQAWAWFFVNVLRRFRRNTAGVNARMNSAAYWLATQAKTDTLRADCRAIFDAYVAASDDLQSAEEIERMPACHLLDYPHGPRTRPLAHYLRAAQHTYKAPPAPHPQPPGSRPRAAHAPASSSAPPPRISLKRSAAHVHTNAADEATAQLLKRMRLRR
jgi:TATA-box binding protein (TBP) (component of TFIID and TFIIIB)